MFRIECDCGQVTEFVEENGVFYRNQKRHGNNAKGLTCFNCNRELTIPSDLIEPEINKDMEAPKKKRTYKKRNKNF